METIRCPRCGPQPANNFGWKTKTKRQPFCRSCQNENTRKWYAKNRKRQLVNVKRNKLKNTLQNRRNIVDYLRLNPCIDCGEVDIIVLDFDHVRGKKENTITMLLQRNCSWETIKKEIAKCAVRCANCHRRKTAKERKFWRDLVGAEALEAPSCGLKDRCSSS